MRNPRSRLWPGLLAIAALLCAVDATAQEDAARARNVPPSPARESVPRYEVQPGDLLHVAVWKEADLDQDVLVRPDGGFSFPLAGDVRAAGKTVEELRLELTEKLSRFVTDLFVTVQVREINGNKIYVIGQVNRPGEFVVNPRVDVMQALTLAGGTTTFASPNGIFVLRREQNQQRTMPFRFDDVVNGKRLEQNILLQSGDVVVVP
jgi:polysaccharide export outer membrane protein